MEKIIKIYNKKTRLIIGLMSGTSHDGIDLALAKIVNNTPQQTPQITLLKYKTYPYQKEIREKISQAFNGSTAEVCRLNFELGEIFAQAILKFIKEADLTVGVIDLIASHGQTIYHIPPTEKASGSTLQIGEGAVIAERIGIVTVSDFRVADMACGGQGAPLVPLADYLLFHKEGTVRVVHNIGGIANLTVVPQNLDEVIAFDTGPGNALIDEAVKIATDNKQSYDEDSKLALLGKVNDGLLAHLLQHPYFAQKPPKSTGRELFGKQMVHDIIEQFGIKKSDMFDLIATLTKFTAESIQLAYQQFVFPCYDIAEIIFTGGGTKNPMLMQNIQEVFAVSKESKYCPKISTIDKFGIPSEAKEALSFAIIGNETISGRPGNVISATGAKKPAILGKVNIK